ncbi:DUF3052 family protein [Chondromyces crocatus]|uniref:DUF3052 domain-containing protein n=1 Tax=Chondromyces crocatus TaxID=52 RepID=A0A0K1ENY6_CHOCO|nr:DUF3052 family protein [Chondromyces crocatus]AKT42539.1 uncharacterized protein CMC5_067660 [Chondromyces crocatus]
MLDALAKKLQIKPESRVLVLDAPDGYTDGLAPLPEGAVLSTTAKGTFDVVHLFVREAKDLAKKAPRALAAVREGGVLWISYPKKSSGVKTDITRDHGWDVVEEAGWGPVSQVSIDDTWSALRWKPEATVTRKAGSKVAPDTRATTTKSSSA